MSKKPHLPLSIQVLYGVGVSYAIVDQIFAQWVLTYYLPPANFSFRPFLSPLFIAMALVISRFVDMVADPLIGYWSDRVDSKWGRRIPFIFLGSIPLAIMTVAFFYPIKTGGVPTFLNLAVVGCLFFIFYTIVGAPYNALIPEISQGQNDRLNLATWQSVFRLIYTAIAMILPGILIKVFGRGDDEFGLRMMVIALAALAVIGMMITSLSINERKYSGGKKSKENLFSSLGTMFSNKSFVLYLFGLLCFFIGFNTLRASMNYYVTDIMGFGPGSITIASALLFGVAAAFFYPINRISKNFGYRKPMLFSLASLVVFSLLLFQLGKLIPANGGFIIFALTGIPVAGAAFIFPPAMLSEISAVAAHKTGRQIEGMFFGMQGFFLKLAFLVSIAALPLILVSGTGISFIQAMTTTPEAPSLSGIYGTTLFSTIFFAFAFLFYLLYPEEIIKED
ncbi:MAG: MFS transporter [Spirochaetia bacterium]